MDEPQSAGELEAYGPVARMMMAVAGQAITGYVQFRSLVELLIAKGVITRDEVEGHFASMREQQLEVTIDEWFPADVAYHVKLALQAAAEPAEPMVSDLSGDRNELERARRMQAGGA